MGPLEQYMGMDYILLRDDYQNSADCRLKDPCQHRHMTQKEKDYSDSDSDQDYTSCCISMEYQSFGMLNWELRPHIGEYVHFDCVSKR